MSADLCLMAIDPGVTGAVISQERLRSVFDYDEITGAFIWKQQRGRARVGDRAGYVRLDGRRVIKVDGRLYLAYRLAFIWQTGALPPEEIDHVDGDGGNDAWANLRQATRSQNELNKAVRSDSKIGLKGVQWSAYHNFWRARFRSKFIGYFKTAEEAHAAYCAASAAFNADFARAS